MCKLFNKRFRDRILRIILKQVINYNYYIFRDRDQSEVEQGMMQIIMFFHGRSKTLPSLFGTSKHSRCARFIWSLALEGDKQPWIPEIRHESTLLRFRREKRRL